MSAAAVMSSILPLFQQLLQLGCLPPFETLDTPESGFDSLDLRLGPTLNQSPPLPLARQCSRLLVKDVSTVNRRTAFAAGKLAILSGLLFV